MTEFEEYFEKLENYLRDNFNFTSDFYALLGGIEDYLSNYDYENSICMLKNILIGVRGIEEEDFDKIEKEV